VYAVGHTRITGTGRLWAATLATDGVLSHRTAAYLWGIGPWPSRLEITTTTERRSTVAFTVHRSRTLCLDAIRRDPEHGLPVTTPARTLTDLKRALTPQRWQRALERAEELRLDVGPHRGESEPVMTRSELEERFLDVVAAAGLDRPRVNTRVAGYEVDFHWPEHALIVETDGWATHGTRAAFERDRRKSNALTNAGHTVLRFTWRDLSDDPAYVCNALRAATTKAA